MDFSGGDSSDDTEWESSLTLKQYEIYKGYIKDHLEDDGKFEILEELFPEWSTIAYNEIVDYENVSFKENEDLEDWGCEEDFENPSWKITDTFGVDISSFKIIS